MLECFGCPPKNHRYACCLEEGTAKPETNYRTSGIVDEYTQDNAEGGATVSIFAATEVCGSKSRSYLLQFPCLDGFNSRRRRRPLRLEARPPRTTGQQNQIHPQSFPKCTCFLIPANIDGCDAQKMQGRREAASPFVGGGRTRRGSETNGRQTINYTRAA